MTIQFNAEQEQAANLINEWLSGNKRHILLSGYPGTGKTFVTANVLKQNVDKLGKFAVATPTHKAKYVAQQNLLEAGLDLDCFTTLSILGLSPDINQDGKRKFDKQKDDRPIEFYDYVWVDECSMIDAEIFNMLIISGTKLLFTGDENQLLPVGSSVFPVFEYFKRHPDCQVTLKKPERYQGAIKDFVYDCLNCVINKTLVAPEEFLAYTPDCTYKNDWFSDWKTNDNDKVVLTFTNNDVDVLNDKCRQYIYGDRAGELVEGEKLLTYGPIADLEGSPMIANGTEIEVESFFPTVKVFGDNSFECWEVNLMGYMYPMVVLAKKERKRYSKYLDSLKLEARRGEIRWNQYYYALDYFARVKPTWALTIHKSQGSGWSDVYVINSFNYLKDAELQPRLHYVAASRAKKNLYYSRKL